MKHMIIKCDGEDDRLFFVSDRYAKELAREVVEGGGIIKFPNRDDDYISPDKVKSIEVKSDIGRAKTDFYILVT